MAQHRPTNSALPDFVGWPTFPFEGNLRVRKLDPPAAEEPPRQGERGESCAKCQATDADYIWIDERWRVRALGKPSGLPAVVVLETRHHYDMGDLSNLLAAELGVLTVRLERAIRSISGVARVHVNRWGDGSEHLPVDVGRHPAADRRGAVAGEPRVHRGMARRVRRPRGGRTATDALGRTRGRGTGRR